MQSIQRAARSVLALMAAIALLVPAALYAQASPAPSATPAKIEAAAGDDAIIAARIKGIFSEIGNLQGVNVRVASGVVTLSGEVPSQTAIDQAVAVAGRVSGVVTVQDKLKRSLNVDNNLNPAIGGLAGKADAIVAAIPLILVAIAVAALVGFAGYWLAARKALWHRIAPNPFLGDLMSTFIRFAFVVGGIVLGLEIIGATALLGAVLGGAGVIGIAIGFAVRDSIDNYVSSLMLSIRQPFRGNDHIKIDEFEGRVVRLTSRATVLMTLDGNHLRIPNSTVFKAVILNFTTNPHRRFTIDFTLDHADEPCLARARGLEALSALDFVLDKPEPSAEITDMPGTTQILRFTGWVDQTKTGFGKARTLAYEAVRSALREASFVLPDATYHVKLEQVEAEAAHPPEPQPAPAMAAATVDTAPDSASPELQIRKMVANERASDDGNDLLDSSRPVE
ncbi:MAG: mechanosensitive ion channel domain-containing protein [Pseudomonadota bacterium]